MNMSEEEKFQDILTKISEIYHFLMDGEPTPDDEIKARENLINYFNELKNLNLNIDKKDLLEKILNDLEAWDTLDLWFSETTIPNDIKLFIGEKEDVEVKEVEENILDEKIESKPKSPEIDVSEIVKMISEKFKEEIEGLKNEINVLKEEIEKKDQAIKSLISNKKVKVITPSKNSRLPPPVIKIPVIKKAVKIPEEDKKSKEKFFVITKEEKREEVIGETSQESVTKEEDLELTPIPAKPEVLKTKEKLLAEKPPSPPVELISSPMTEHDQEFLESEDSMPSMPMNTIKTEEVVEKEPSLQKEKILDSIQKKIEKPKITSVSVEEVDTVPSEEPKSSLFNVFSSVGQSPLKSSTDSSSREKPKIGIFVTAQEEEPQQEVASLSKNSLESESQAGDSLEMGEDLPLDKDSLYQELIALEGKRYSMEKSFKELERSYDKGSISAAQYRSQSEKLRIQLKQISDKINKIRRLISTL